MIHLFTMHLMAVHQVIPFPAVSRISVVHVVIPIPACHLQYIIVVHLMIPCPVIIPHHRTSQFGSRQPKFVTSTKRNRSLFLFNRIFLLAVLIPPTRLSSICILSSAPLTTHLLPLVLFLIISLVISDPSPHHHQVL